jgi:hypothetical protein
MTAQTSAILKAYFNTGDIPTEGNFADLVDSLPSVFNVHAYGAAGNGMTDDTAAVQAAIQAAYDADGGVVLFGAKTYLISSQIVMPYSGASKMPPIMLMGLGSQGASDMTAGVYKGTILDMRATTAPAKIDTRGAGLLKIEGINFTTGLAGDTNPFIQTTNTALIIRDCALIGDETQNTQTCVQDAIVLGGLLASRGMTANNGFQGYGTIIESCYFRKVRRGVFCRTWSNNVFIIRNTWDLSCGAADATSAAVDCTGLITNIIKGLVIRDNLFEVTGYPYAIKMTYAADNLIEGNSFWDGSGTIGLGGILMDVGATGNIVICGFNGQSGLGGGMPTIVEDGSVTGKNMVLNLDNSGWSGMTLPKRMTITEGGASITDGLLIPSGGLVVKSLPVFANNTAAANAGYQTGTFYRSGGDPDVVCVVH